MSTKNPSNKIGRDAGNGQFITVKKARDNPRTSVVETIRPKPTKPTKK